MKFFAVFCFLLVSAFGFADEPFVMPADPTVILQTNQGDIELRLFPAVAPKAVENFIRLVESGYYDNTVFHRIMRGFVIQGGDPSGKGTGGKSIWGKPFEDEFDPNVVYDKPGLLGMANTGPNTNGSQFFITLAPTPWLNRQHTIFGEVAQGMDVVRSIENAPVPPWYYFSPPGSSMEPQIIFRAYLKK